MTVKRKPRKRLKKSGILYFAVNNRVPNIVKIGMTTDSAESRLMSANRKNEFMCGTWSIAQKVATNDVKRTEDLAHTIFKNFHDAESVSSEIYFIPSEMTVKKMADYVREKDKVIQERNLEKEKVLAQLESAKKNLEAINQETLDLISLEIKDTD